MSTLYETEDLLIGGSSSALWKVQA